MKLLIKLLGLGSIFVLITNSFAEFPFILIDERKLTKMSSFEIGQMPPIKDQGKIGLCYGFTATALLENYRCRELMLDCHNKAELLSTLDVSSYDLNLIPTTSRNLVSGGIAKRVLHSINVRDASIASDKCVTYSSFNQASGMFGDPTMSQKKGWDLLTKKWNEFNRNQEKKVSSCITCMVDEIKKKLKNLKTSSAQLEDAFVTSISSAEFLFKAIIPEECLQDSKTLSIPSYEILTYPTSENESGPKFLAKKIETLLLNNIPLEISIRLPSDSEFGIHSVVLTGIKKLCSSKSGNCIRLVKVQNSWGETWQKSNNNGWVDLYSLTTAATPLTNNITWLQKPGTLLVEKEL